MRRLAAAITVAALAAACGPGRLQDVRSRLRCEGCTVGPDGVALVDFGADYVRTPGERSVEIVNDGAETAHFRMPAATPPFSLAAREVELQQGASVRLAIAHESVAPGDEEQVLAFTGASMRLVLRARAEVPGVDCSAEQRLDFGDVVLGTERAIEVSCTNRSAQLAVGIASRPTEPGPFSSNTQATLAPAASEPVTVRFRPGELGPAAGGLVIKLDPPGQVAGLVLSGTGVETGLHVDPAVEDPGCYEMRAVPGNVATLRLHLRNSGNLPVAVQSAALDPAQPPFAVSPQGGFLLPAWPPGGPVPEREVDVTFAPVALGTYAATLVVRSDDRLGDRTFCIRGEAAGFEPWPADGLDFGRVRPGSSRLLHAVVQSTGEEGCCAVTAAVVEGDDAAAFRVSPELPAQVGPGQPLVLAVRFEPAREGSFAARLVLAINGVPLAFPLRGEGAASCLESFPDAMDLGEVRPGCRSASRQIQLANRCAERVDIPELGFLTASGDEMMADLPAAPTSLPAGGTLDVPVRYLPRDGGADAGILRVVQADGGMLATSLHGRAGASTSTTDRFSGGGRAAADVLWLMDGDYLIAPAPPSESEAATTYLRPMVESGVDFHLAVTTSSIWRAPDQHWLPLADGAENSRFFPVDGRTPRILHSGIPFAELEQDWRESWDVGPRFSGWTTHVDSQRIAVVLALRPPLISQDDDPRFAEPHDGNLGFLRTNADLHVVVVDYANDAIQDPPAEETLADLLSIMGGRLSMLHVHAFGFPPDRPPPADRDECSGVLPSVRLADLTQATSGVFYYAGVCYSWPEGATYADLWAPGLVAIAAQIAATPHCYALTSLPDEGLTGDPADGFEVVVDGEPFDRVGPEGTRFRFDPGANQICFAAASAPGPEAFVEVTYPIGCGE